MQLPSCLRRGGAKRRGGGSRTTNHKSRFTVQAALAAIVLLAATLSHAAPPEPFLDQPGALSEAEIQAAQNAMKPMLGAEPEFPLATSGRRMLDHPMPAYAVFAAPPVRKSGRVMVERRVICNFFGSANIWRCSMPHDALQVEANGVKHKFSLQAIEGPAMDHAEAVEVADYLYSACFAAQFKALDKVEDMPSFNAYPIHTITKRSGTAYSVWTGAWPDEDIYSLVVEGRKGDGCGYKIVNVTIGRKDWEKQLADKRKKEEKAALAELNRGAPEATVRESPKDPEIRSRPQVLKPDELLIFGLVLGVTAVYVLAPFLVVMLLVWLIWAIARIYKPGLSPEWPWAISGFALIAFVVHLIM